MFTLSFFSGIVVGLPFVLAAYWLAQVVSTARIAGKDAR